MTTNDHNEELKNLKNESKADAHAVADDVRAVADDVKASATESVESAKQQARSQAETGKSRLAEELDHVAHAAEKAAADLHDNNDDALSHYVGDMASTVGQLASGLREKSVDDLVRDVQGIARKNPALFIAGSIAVGIGIARFAKATEHRDQYATDRIGNGRSRDTSGTYNPDRYYDTTAERNTNQTNRYGAQATQMPAYDSSSERTNASATEGYSGAPYRDLNTADSLVDNEPPHSFDAKAPQQLDDPGVGNGVHVVDTKTSRPASDTSSDTSTSL